MPEIRPARPGDEAAIARVHVDTWRTTYAGIVSDEHLAALSYERSEAKWAERIVDPQMLVFVAELEPGLVVGFASGGAARKAVAGCDGELYALYVFKANQGHGYGRRLVEAMAGALRERGFRSMVIWALKGNPACGFYEAMGGRQAGESTIEIGGEALPELAYSWPDLSALLPVRGGGGR